MKSPFLNEQIKFSTKHIKTLRTGIVMKVKEVSRFLVKILERDQVNLKF